MAGSLDAVARIPIREVAIVIAVELFVVQVNLLGLYCDIGFEQQHKQQHGPNAVQFFRHFHSSQVKSQKGIVNSILFWGLNWNLEVKNLNV